MYWTIIDRGHSLHQVKSNELCFGTASVCFDENLNGRECVADGEQKGNMTFYDLSIMENK